MKLDQWLEKMFKTKQFTAAILWEGKIGNMKVCGYQIERKKLSVLLHAFAYRAPFEMK